MKIEILESNNNLESYYYNKEESSYNYRLVFSNKKDVDNLKSELEKNVNVEFIDIKYAL